MPVHTIATYRRRLKERPYQHYTGAEIEAHVFATTRIEQLNQEEHRRLQWICEKIVWPVTRRRSRPRPNPTPSLFEV